MGKKNIKPNLNQPVIRTNVAKPAIEGLTEENLTTTTTARDGVAPSFEKICWDTDTNHPPFCSYDGDDGE